MPHRSRLAIGLLVAALPFGSALADPREPSDRSAPVTRQASEPAHETASPVLSDLIAQTAHDYGVPVGLAQAVIKIESRGNPRARNHGAMGLMQIKTQTARNLGFSGAASGLLLPDTNLHYGMRVLADAYKASGGDVCRTLASYQSGHAVRRFSRAQRAYCGRARAIMAKA